MKAHKIRIFPNKEQEAYLIKACGTSRFAYNWALSKWKEQYEAGLKPNVNQLNKELNSVKKERFPWMLEVTKCAPQRAIKDLGTAFDRFFKKQNGYPKFKKKGQKDSFYISNDQCEIIGKELFVPKLKMPINCSEELRFTGKKMSYVISRDVDRWYVSITVETDHKLQRKESRGTVGIDLGIKTLATLSDGVIFETKKFYHKAEKKLKKLQRRLSKKQKGSANRAKAKLKLAKQHRKIRFARKDYLHQITTFVVTHYNKVVIEDLNVKGMVKNHKLAKAISNMGFGTFRSMLETKAKDCDCEVIVADRFFASSKLCSKCGNKKVDLKLSDRIYKCECCGLEIDRDLNASINLRELGSRRPDEPVDSTEDLSNKAVGNEAGTEVNLC